MDRFFDRENCRDPQFTSDLRANKLGSGDTAFQTKWRTTTVYQISTYNVGNFLNIRTKALIVGSIRIGLVSSPENKNKKITHTGHTVL